MPIPVVHVDAHKLPDVPTGRASRFHALRRHPQSMPARASSPAPFRTERTMSDTPVTPDQPTDEQPQPPAQESHDTAGPDWKAEARKWESRAKENRDASTAQEQKLAAVLSALGIGDKQEDPAAAVERYKAEARAAQVEAAIVLNAGDADPKRLLDSVSFRESIKDIDPK